MFDWSRFITVFSLVLGGVITTLSGSAMGQTIAMSPTSPIVRAPARTNATDKNVAMTLTGGDCDDKDENGNDVEYTFNVNTTGYSLSYALEVWAGPADCAAQYTNAEGLRDCWQLKVDKKITNNTISLQYKPSELFGVGTGKSRAIIKECSKIPDVESAQTYAIYFLLTNSNTVKVSAKQELRYDLSGPTAPTGVKLGIAESALKASWDPVTDEGEIVYKFYCAEAEGDEKHCVSSLGESASGGSGGSGGADGSGGSGGDAGSSQGGTASSSTTAGGTTSATTATSNGTSVGGDSSSGGSTSWNAADYPESFICGKIRGKMNASGFTDNNLKNGKLYAVSVVAVDIYGNESKPSTPVCKVPDFVDTFFEHYRNKGGKSGGPFCALSHGGQALSVTGLLLFALGATAFIRRRNSN
jgi:hypothetical protein